MSHCRSLESRPPAPTRLRPALFALALSGTLVLAACTKQPGGAPDLTPVSKVGHVVVTELSVADGVSLSAQASFIKRDTAVPPDVLDREPFGQPLGSCQIATHAGTVTSQIAPAPVEYLPAGDSVSLRQGGAQLVALPRDTESGRYHASASAGLATTDLTVTVAGALQFKPFAVSVPVAPSLMVAPATAITGGTKFTWVAGDGDAAVVLIGGNDSASFSCVVADTGLFEFSADDQAALTEAGFADGWLATTGRLGAASKVDGDSMLLVSVARLTAHDAGKAE